MDLKEKSEKYVVLKKGLESDRKELDVLKQQESELFRLQRKYENAIKKAEKAGDAAAKESAEKTLKEVNEKIEKHRDALIEKKDSIKLYETGINEQIQDMLKNPEMQKAMDEALVTRYTRQLEKLTPEREKLNDKKTEKENTKNGLEALKKLIDTKPEAGKKLADLIKAQQDYVKLNNELSKLDYIKDAPRIADIVKNLIPNSLKTIELSRENILIGLSANGANMSARNFDYLIETIIKNGVTLDKAGNIKMEETLDNNIDITAQDIKNINKDIRSYDKRIRNYSQFIAEREEASNTQQQIQTPQTTEKPKWYQFRKRFTAWREARKQEQLPAPENVDKSEIFNNELTRDAFLKGIGRSGEYNGEYEMEAIRKAKANAKAKEKEEETIK